MLNGLSLRFKLIASFCLVAIILMAVSYKGYHGTANGALHLKQIREVDLPGLIALTKMQDGQSQVRVNYRSVENRARPLATRAKYRDGVIEAWKSIDEGRATYDKLPRCPAEAAKWDSCKKAWDAWKEDFDKFHVYALQSLAESDPVKLDTIFVKMREVMGGRIVATAKESVDDMKNLVDYKIKTVYSNCDDAITSANKATAWTFGFSLAGLVIALGFGIWISSNLTRRLHGIVKAASDGTDQIAAATVQVSDAVRGVAEGSQKQAESVEQTGSDINEMTSATQTNASSARSAQQIMAEARSHVNEAGNSAQAMEQAMTEIVQASDQTSKIVKTIDEISFQTNLLALNAAVEAARAGEAGKGFAVVAEEVRNLAMRAAEAAKNTGSLIEENVNRVNRGSGIITGLRSSLDSVADSADKAVKLIEQVAVASEDQASGWHKVNNGVSSINQAIQSNAASAEEAASASAEAAGQTEKLHSIIGDLVDVVNGIQRP